MSEPDDGFGRPVSTYQVKQFVARIRTDRGLVCNVFTTSDDRYYLFDPIEATGCSLGAAWPVLRKRLPTAWRRALAHGQGNVEDVVAPTSGRSPIVQVSADVWVEALAALQREREAQPHGPAA